MYAKWEGDSVTITPECREDDFALEGLMKVLKFTQVDEVGKRERNH